MVMRLREDDLDPAGLSMLDRIGYGFVGNEPKLQASELIKG